MELMRRIKVRTFSEEDLSTLSDKIVKSPDYKLLPNMKEVIVREDSCDFKYKRHIRTKVPTKKEWEKHWDNMTYFNAEDNNYFSETVFNFDSSWSNERLSELFDQTFTVKTKSIFFPTKDVNTERLNRVYGNKSQPRYPIYILSKGRSKTCTTADHFIKMNVPFTIVIEKQEWEDYASVYGEDCLLELDMQFREDYDVYIKDFDDNKSKGSGPARNFIWWHSKNVAKADWHWIIDDNMLSFHAFTGFKRPKVIDGTIFSAAEDFVNRYQNIGIAGFNYFSFAVPGNKDKPYVANTKIYSCILINNSVPIRWGGRYNEDVDICIRSLKEGFSTIQFDAFLANKLVTQSMGGGNTDAFYAEEGTLPKSNMLMHNHPDITDVVWKFQRWHHRTDYNIFDYYKDRTIGKTIVDMMKHPVLNREDDKDIIQSIMELDLNWIQRWNVLETVEPGKREQILDVVKFYKYTKDNARIVDILCAPKILDCDYYDFIWDNPIPDTVDNKIMKDLLELQDADEMLFNSVNWNEYLDYVPVEQRQRIAAEMERNKYLLNVDHEIFEYDLKTIKITEEEHDNHRDSQAEIFNNYVNIDDVSVQLDVPVTTWDLSRRGELKTTKSTHKNRLTSRVDTAAKEHEGHVVMIHGCSEFNNEDMFIEKIKELLNPETKEIINAVEYPVDLMSANYSLNNKITSRDFVPDHVLYSSNSYIKLYALMAEYADECILFIDSKIDDNIQSLLDSFENFGKPVNIIMNSKQTETLDDW